MSDEVEEAIGVVGTETNTFLTKEQLEHSTRNPFLLLLEDIPCQPLPLSSVYLIGPDYSLINQSHLSHILFPDTNIIHSCNDLLCLKNNTGLSIINPTTRQIRHVLAKALVFNNCFGFGFSALADDYKIVRISPHDNAKVYSLTFDYWRKIDAPPKVQPWRRLSRFVAITGTIFWLDLTVSDSGTICEYVLSFDVGRELFRLFRGPLMLPSRPCSNFVLAVWNNELALFPTTLIGMIILLPLICGVERF
ncbi:hypothetical protein VNO80_11986 [Phaseolus coccineus]|uniref:F-box associated beta-propeller type 1 domain-containing protein n=1 Tax=Phaseolus coccineus TaxID=3886 RepID=A0AAN9NHH5_PHACN